MKTIFLFLLLASCSSQRPNYAARFVSTVSTAKCLAWGAQGDVSAAMCVAEGSVYFCTATPVSVPKCEAVSGPARAAKHDDPKKTEPPSKTDDPPSPPHHPEPARRRP